MINDVVDVYPASICEDGLGSRNSVCHTAKLNDALQVFWYHTKGQSLCYYGTNSGWWATLPSLWNLHSKLPCFEKCRLWQIFAYNVSTVKDSEKKFNYVEYKVHHGLSNEL